jgi:hypothetical protein
MTARTKSPVVEKMDSIQKQVGHFLKLKGFKKVGRSFNRSAMDGIVHVVGFQMGEYPIGNYVVPGLRENLYGKFTVNLGVSLPCVLLAERGNLPKSSVHDYDCEIRGRLSSIANIGPDVWWPLDDSISETADQIISHLSKSGLSFFENYSSYDLVLGSYQKFDGFPNQNAGRAALGAAITAWAIGDRSQSDKLFETALAHADSTNHKGFRSHIILLKGRLEA